MHRLSDFDFQLPEDLIAQHPLAERSASRLLEVVPFVENFLIDRNFAELPALLAPHDLLVFNDSRVIAARLIGAKESGGHIEVLLERITNPFEALVLLRASKKPPPGGRLFVRKQGVKGELGLTVLGRDPVFDDRFLVRFDEPVLNALDKFGEMPLPPYIAHRPTREDEVRYQTVYARVSGSVAAPTAGLHFDPKILDLLNKKSVRCAYVTLHVGSGTFAPVRTEDLEQHQMHSEWCEIPPATAEAIARTRGAGGRVIAVGTTSLRTLESLALPSSLTDGSDSHRGLVASGTKETDLFILPGYRFKVVDGLLTNFHLPKSTLLMLVSAFIGHDRMRYAYAHAIANRYRFFSYGDAMFLHKFANN